MPAFVACNGENNLRLPVGAGFWLQKNRPFATKNLASGNQKNRPFAITNYPYSSFLNRDILGSSLLLLRNSGGGIWCGDCHNRPSEAQHSGFAGGSFPTCGRALCVGMCLNERVWGNGHGSFI